MRSLVTGREFRWTARSAWSRLRLRQVQPVLMRPLAQRQPAQCARQSFSDGTVVPALGQGSCGSLERENILKLLKKKRYALAFRSELTLIDTAEVYGSVNIYWPRDRRSAQSRVPSLQGVAQSCGGKRRHARLRGRAFERLGTDHLDLYLLHWPDGVTNLLQRRDRV